LNYGCSNLIEISYFIFYLINKLTCFVEKLEKALSVIGQATPLNVGLFSLTVGVDIDPYEVTGKPVTKTDKEY